MMSFRPVKAVVAALAATAAAVGGLMVAVPDATAAQAAVPAASHSNAAPAAAIPGHAWGQTGPATDPAAETGPAVTPDIVGGSPASQPAPFTGSLRINWGDGRGPVFACSVNLIARFADGNAVMAAARQAGVPATPALINRLAGTSWAWTNAHCLTDIRTLSATPFAPSLLQVGLGSNNRSQQTIYPVRADFVYPYWNWGNSTGPDGEVGDAGLVEIGSWVPEQPALIGGAPAGTSLLALGWGATTHDGTGVLPDALQQLTLTTTAAPGCSAADPPIGPGEQCLALPAAGTLGPCFGDSGGFVGKALPHGRFLLVGSLSRGNDDDQGVCAVPGDNAIISTPAWPPYAGWLLSTILGMSPPRGTPADTTQAQRLLAGAAN